MMMRSVAVLPSDHYFSDERGFSVALESAFETAAQHPWSVILLGASPQGPEVEYGWIETGPPVHSTGGDSLGSRGSSKSRRSTWPENCLGGALSGTHL